MSALRICVLRLKGDLRIVRHLDRLWAVLGLSSAQNQRFTLFFDTPRSLFAHNLSKVYGGATLVREISPEIRMRCRKNVSRPGFLPKNPDEMQENRLYLFNGLFRFSRGRQLL